MLVAEIYPLCRMPRSLSVLDYRVPDTMCLTRGSFVEISLRSKHIAGCVKRIKQIQTHGIRLKDVHRVIDERALSTQELSFFERQAFLIAQPVSRLMFLSIPLLLKSTNAPNHVTDSSIPLTIPAREAPTISRIVTDMAKRRTAFIQASDLRRMAAVIAGYDHRNPSQKIMVICPHVRDVQLLGTALSTCFPILVTSKETKLQRYQRWKKFREALTGMLITTRVGQLYVDEFVTAVFVVKSGHPDHVSHQQHPRLDARRVVLEFASHLHCRAYFLDVSPRAEDIWTFGKNHLIEFPISAEPTFIDAARERPVSSHPVLTTSTLHYIQASIESHKRVLLICNKKGYATCMICRQCQQPLKCQKCHHVLGLQEKTLQCHFCRTQEPVPSHCFSCRSIKLFALGYGLDRLAEGLQQFFPGVEIAVFDRKASPPNDAPIILSTRAYLDRLFNPFHQQLLGAIIHLDADTPLFSPDVHAETRALRAVMEWRGVAHASHASLYVQTDEIDWYKTAFADSVAASQTELTKREEYQQPPFTQWVLVRLKESEIRRQELEMHLLKTSLELIEGVQVNYVQSPSSMKTQIQVRFMPALSDTLLEFFANLDDRFIVDMHAYTG